MKHFYRIAWKTVKTPEHLAVSVILSFAVMMYVNVFVGSMGGIPSFIGFLIIFYLLRGIILSEPKDRPLELTGKDMAWLMVHYAFGYLAIWVVMKLLLLLSTISGWGNIVGVTVGEYFDLIYGSTMMERWAYIFSGILMFAMIMSLFPLIVIRRRKRWLIYLLADGVCFAVVCGLIAWICRFFIVEDKRNWAACVLDDMLLCENPAFWQASMYIIGIILFTLAVIAAVYRIACHSCSFLPQKQAPLSKSWNELKGPVCIIAVVLIVVIAGIGWFFFGSKEKNEYEKVAEFLTEDSSLGPLVYDDTVYIPVDGDWSLVENGTVLGYLAYKGEECDSRFYELVISNLLYQDASVGEDLLEMEGADFGRYRKAAALEQENAWKEDSVFLLWDEEWLQESSYNDATGYSICDRAMIEGLEEKFGEVAYDPSDFTEYDTYFTIRSYGDMKEAVEDNIAVGNWVGCILVKDNKFYYGSYENQITDMYLQQLLDVLGGN